jgi:RimJ/RimL family protein N-acetyltransferase
MRSIHRLRSRVSCECILRHNLHVSGHAYGLRPVEEADAAFIADLRRRCGRFLNRGAVSTGEQVAWLESYFERRGDYYFVIEAEDDRRREGLVGLYGLDPEHRAAEWGRWVLEPGSNAAIESALLIYRCAFVELALERVWCRTLADNVKVVAFHDSCGLERAPATIMIEHDGERCPAVEHTLSRSDSSSVMTRLDRLAARIASSRQRTSITMTRS